MSRLTIEAGERKRYGMAVAGGLLLAAAFPKIGLAGFAWLAPGVMLMAAIGRSGAAAFRIGYVAGLAFYLAALYWLLLIPLAFTPIVGWLSLGIYLALYPGVWVWLCWKTYPAPACESSGWAPLLDWFVAPSWPRRLGWTLFCAMLWVALEMIIGRLFTGFPWNFVGASQYRILPIIQIASVTGVYGISFLVVWFSVSLASAFAMLIRRPQVRWHAQRELLAPLLVGAAVAALGWHDLMQPAPRQPALKAVLVQPSIPQTWIWDSDASSNRFQQLLQLTEQALTNHPDLLVWPEAAVPYMLRFDENIYSAVTNLVQRHKVWLVLGSDDGEVDPQPDGRTQTNYFNSSFLVRPDGEIMASYRKRNLVIFGEYIPFGRRFAWIERFTGMGSFARGDRPGFFSIPELRAKASVLICFEDVFPHLTRASVQDDTDFVLNLTNNGWFDESAAQWQHAANAVFRAVENRIPLVRCANNGLTCWVDEHGRMNDVLFAADRRIYGIGFETIEVPLLGGHNRTPTFYHRHGDWFGWGCVGLSAAILLWRLIRHKS